MRASITCTSSYAISEEDVNSLEVFASVTVTAADIGGNAVDDVATTVVSLDQVRDAHTHGFFSSPWGPAPGRKLGLDNDHRAWVGDLGCEGDKATGYGVFEYTPHPNPASQRYKRVIFPYDLLSRREVAQVSKLYCVARVVLSL